MSKSVPTLVLLLAALPGCALYHTRSDADAVRFAQAWETPRLAQQSIVLEFKTEGDCNDAALFHEATKALINSGKFRPARPGETATVKIELTVAVRRKTHVFKTVCNALILYLWPIDAQDYVFEAFAVVRKPSGELIKRCYAQGRGRHELWLGYLLWPQWIWNSDEADVIHRDTLKAAVVKMCRALMPEAPK